MSTLPHPKTAREALGLRKVDLASRVGVALNTVNRCEAVGRYPRNLPTRRAYLSALGLSEPAPGLAESSTVPQGSPS